MNKFLLLLSVFVVNQANANTKLPLSQLSITSKKMVGSVVKGADGKKNKGEYFIEYSENVRVLLADSTEATAQKLDVILNRYASKSKKNKQLKEKDTLDSSLYKQVVLHGDVHLKRKDHIVVADKAEFLVPKQVCKVSGNVRITQLANSTGAIPFVTETNTAYLDLTSEKLVLVGSEYKPVSTILTFPTDPKKQLKVKSSIKKHE